MNAKEQELAMWQLKTELRDSYGVDGDDVDYLITGMQPADAIVTLSEAIQKVKDLNDKYTDEAERAKNRSDLVQVLKQEKDLLDMNLKPSEVAKLVDGKPLADQKEQLAILLQGIQAVGQSAQNETYKLDAAGKAIKMMDVLDANGNLDPAKLNRLTAAQLAPVLQNKKASVELDAMMRKYSAAFAKVGLAEPGPDGKMPVGVDGKPLKTKQQAIADGSLESKIDEVIQEGDLNPADLEQLGRSRGAIAQWINSEYAIVKSGVDARVSQGTEQAQIDTAKANAEKTEWEAKNSQINYAKTAATFDSEVALTNAVNNRILQSLSGTGGSGNVAFDMMDGSHDSIFGKQGQGGAGAVAYKLMDAPPKASASPDAKPTDAKTTPAAKPAPGGLPEIMHG